MRMPVVGRNFRAAFAGIIAVALQQWPISYEIDLYGVHASASLAHLHTGVLLALAMLFRDRLYLRIAFVCVYLGWVFRAVVMGYSGIQLAIGLPFQLVMYFWTIWCARLMGWPPATPRGFSLVAAILDYRFALVAVLTWCALRMNLRLVMPLLISVQLLLVVALAQASPLVEGAVGLLGLLKVAFELSVLQLLIIVLLLMQRDGEGLLDHLREESQHEAITGLRNLNGL